MPVWSRDVSQHVSIADFTSQIMRSPSPYFCPPVPTHMPEPGMMWTTIVTADGPHTLEHPGLTGGRLIPSNNNWRVQDPVPPLTHKGG